MARTWFITGSSVGLGYSIVEAALAAGHQVVATARKPQTLDKLVERYPGRLLTLPLDVGVIVDWDKAIAAATDRFGGIDVLVNNAGFGGVGSVEDIPVEIISQLLDTNFMGAVHACKSVLPVMRRQGHGRIILISSIGARVATPGLSIYYASKAAVSALAETLALEVAPFGIKVTAVEPGAMRIRFRGGVIAQGDAVDPTYDGTVGETVAMMQPVDYASFLHDPDPAGHVAMVLKVAALEDAPARILAGEDAFAMGTAAGAKLATDDTRWETVSRSATQR
jgi:NAD(P)-dependent dehydrogenase (short-subunit alcohol dehydrogenase family)